MNPSTKFTNMLEHFMTILTWSQEILVETTKGSSPFASKMSLLSRSENRRLHGKGLGFFIVAKTGKALFIWAFYFEFDKTYSACLPPIRTS